MSNRIILLKAQRREVLVDQWRIRWLEIGDLNLTCNLVLVLLVNNIHCNDINNNNSLVISVVTVVLPAPATTLTQQQPQLCSRVSRLSTSTGGAGPALAALLSWPTLPGVSTFYNIQPENTFQTVYSWTQSFILKNLN